MAVKVRARDEGETLDLRRARGLCRESKGKEVEMKDKTVLPPHSICARRMPEASF